MWQTENGTVDSKWYMWCLYRILFDGAVVPVTSALIHVTMLATRRCTVAALVDI